MENNFWDLYNTERDKLTCLPDADADMTALSIACEKDPQEYFNAIKGERSI